MFNRIALVAIAVITLAASSNMQDDRDKITDKARATIDKGIKWLLKAQNKDGSWGIDSKTPGDVTCTALGAMALMAAGNTEKSGPDNEAHEAIQKAYNWILTMARKNPKKITNEQSTLIQGKLGTNVHAFIGTVFLTQAYGMRIAKDDAKELREILQKLVDFIASAQDSDGSWHRQTFGALKATSQAWLALRSSDRAGIVIKKAAVEKTVRFLKSQFNSSTGLFDIQGHGGFPSIYNTSSSVRVLCGMGEANSKEVEQAVPAFIKACKNINLLAYEGEDFMAAALMSHAMLIKGGKAWDEWYKYIRDLLISKQNGDGSWTGTACISGRTFATTNALIALLSPLRHLPIAEI